jgi:hypothetical protein
MEVLAVLLSIAISSNDFLILHDAVVSTSAVNLHEVLVYHTTCTDIKVAINKATTFDELDEILTRYENELK